LRTEARPGSARFDRPRYNRPALSALDFEVFMRARPGRLLAALLLGAVLMCLHSRGFAEAPARFTVAILRRDGVILPLGTYDGNRWVNRWPAESATEFPIGLTDVPKAWWPAGRPVLDWVAWFATGGSQAIKVQAPVRLDVHCTKRIALRTDFSPGGTVPPGDVQPYPKIGLAVNGAATIERIETLPPASPDAKSLAARVTDTLNGAETKRVREWSAQWKHPAAESVRAKTPLTLEVLTRSSGLDSASRVYYFEGIKQYDGFVQVDAWQPSRMGKKCEFLTAANGWLLTNEKTDTVKAIVGANLTNCNRQGVVYALPLGAIRTGGRLFWVVQNSSWEFESYSVMEIKADDVKPVLTVGGGFCS
jgi:hypothetical protein